ncbi:hypothetical protein M413DRAFT_370568 [Hebeloma cylindrosporum]|uniref:Uncharacterized protein n=1 Tax=Hebeloma cylindrosporum TaxID=76867 RepID=A0A0C3BSF2_HEBCY|nr:hypothetical protein M413DRAFT_370568 [Hebeloma cylindrosporum h7]
MLEDHFFRDNHPITCPSKSGHLLRRLPTAFSCCRAQFLTRGISGIPIPIFFCNMRDIGSWIPSLCGSRPTVAIFLGVYFQNSCAKPRRPPKKRLHLQRGWRTVQSHKFCTISS